MITLQKNPNRDFKILNLADTQLSFGEWEEGNAVGKSMCETVCRLVEQTKPDFITHTGDLSYAGSFVSYQNTGKLLNSFGIPWTLVWGNHDNQKGSEPVQQVLSEYKAFSHFVFENDDAALGNSDFTIGICEGDAMPLGLIMMDSHDRDPFVTESGEEVLAWAKVTPAQVEWYKKQAAFLREKGCFENLILLHTPIFAYREAYRAAAKDPDKKLTIAESYLPENWNEGYKDSFGVRWEEVSSYPADDGMLDAIIQSGVKTTVLCGHDHVNNYVIRYKGVRLAFATKTGFGCYGRKELNGGTLITVNHDGISDLRHIYIELE